MQLIILRSSQPYLSVSKAIKSYKNSKAEQHLHKYQIEQKQIINIKKNIDYKTINKNSKGRFMFRQFLFQEKVEQNYIPPLNLCLMSVGKWTQEELRKGKNQQGKTATENINDQIIQSCKPAFEAIFKEYYRKQGKRNHKFILGQQIGKLSQMTEQEFNQLVNTLGDQPDEVNKKSTANDIN